MGRSSTFNSMKTHCLSVRRSAARRALRRWGQSTFPPAWPALPADIRLAFLLWAGLIEARRSTIMQSNVDVVKSAYETAENPLDLDTFASLFSDNGYLYDVSGGKKYYGRDVADLVEHFPASFTDIHRTLDHIIDHGATSTVEPTNKQNQ